MDWIKSRIPTKSKSGNSARDHQVNSGDLDAAQSGQQDTTDSATKNLELDWLKKKRHDKHDPLHATIKKVRHKEMKRCMLRSKPVSRMPFEGGTRKTPMIVA